MKKITGSHSFDAEFAAVSKILEVVGDNVAAIGGKSQFEDHIVLGIGQERSPQKVDGLKMCLACEIAKKTERHFRIRTGRKMFWTSQNILPLSVKSHRQCHMESRVGDRTDESETRPALGSRCRDQNGCVKNHSHWWRICHHSLERAIQNPAVLEPLPRQITTRWIPMGERSALSGT